MEKELHPLTGYKYTGQEKAGINRVAIFTNDAGDVQRMDGNTVRAMSRAIIDQNGPFIYDEKLLKQLGSAHYELPDMIMEMRPFPALHWSHRHSRSGCRLEH